MAWTAPSAKASTDGMTVAEWNTYIRDNLAAIVERPTCGLSDSRTASADYVLANGTTYAIHWYDEDWDSHGVHSTSSNRSRITAPTGWAGVYLVLASVTVAGGDPDGYRRASIRKNGSTIYGESEQTPASGKGRTTVHVAAFVDLSVGDYVEIETYQNSGTTLQLLGNLDDDELGCTCQVIYWGDTASNSSALNLTGPDAYSDLDDWWDGDVVGSFSRLRSRPVARFSSSTTSVADSTWATLTTTSEVFDNCAMHSTSSNTSRLTAPIDGMYLVIAQGGWASSTVGNRSLRLKYNGNSTGVRSQSPPISGALSVQVAAFVALEAGEYMEVEIYHESGSSMDVGTWMSMGWCGQLTKVATAQRLTEDWSDDPYAGGGQLGFVPRPWMDVHTRDLPGIVQCPPAVNTRARFTRDITQGEWKKAKFNRQAIDTWSTVRGVRNFGEKYVIPIDGLYLFGAQMNIKDDSTISAKFSVKTTTFTVDTATDIVTATGHGFRSGAPVYLGTTGTLPAGLDGDELFVRRLSDNTLYLVEFRRHALRNTYSAMDITSTGSGTHRISNSMIDCRGLNLRTGVRVQFSTTGTLPDGLSTATDYWVIRIGPNKFRVAPTEEFAYDGTYSPIYDSGSGVHTVTVMEPYGARGCRLVHAGEVQGGWLGEPAPSFETSRPVLALIAAEAGDEVWTEVLTTGPEGSRITAETPSSRMWACWLGPFAYTGALPMADRPLT
jgi:hypothetical protein